MVHERARAERRADLAEADKQRAEFDHAQLLRNAQALQDQKAQDRGERSRQLQEENDRVDDEKKRQQQRRRDRGNDQGL